MKHRVGYNRLGRKPSHRKALHRNMVTSLFKHERIRTTKAKAQAIRRTAEKMITRAKIDSVHNRRMIGRDIKDKAILAKLFTEIGPRFKERPGGYTRILKIGPRPGDAAEMVLLELVGEMTEKPKNAEPEAKADKPKATAKKASTKKSESAKKDEPAEEQTEEKAEAQDLATDEPAAEETTDAETSEAPADASEDDAPEDATEEKKDATE